MTSRRVATILLALYVLGVAVVALWPHPIDRDFTTFLDRVLDAVPWLTYRRVEFAANVAFFVPYGALLTLALPRSAHLVLPIAILTTAAIEGAQAMLPERTTSVSDLIANIIGACIGIVLASALVGLSRRVQPEAQSPRRI